MAKDKDKKKNKGKKKSSAASAAASGLKTLTQNPLLADVVAATLVAAASALKDSNKARRLAESAGDELEALSRRTAERGNVMWKLALDIGREALETLTAEKPRAVRAAAPAGKHARAKKRATGEKRAAPRKTAAKTRKAK